MTKGLLTGVLLLHVLCPGNFVFAQEQEKKAEEPPKLEIPEITIIGKKAITLPFARKGEIYDVDIFTAPEPDSSLLGLPPAVSLLTGALPRYEQQQKPWRLSVEGGLGSFSKGSAGGYLDYKAEHWGLMTNLGFATTNGHTKNASASQFGAGSAVLALVNTDNQILKSFRASAGLNISRYAYGLYGITGSTVRRTDNQFDVHANLGTLHRAGSVLDLELGAVFTSLTDSYSGTDSSVSIVSPGIKVLYSTGIRNVDVETGISYSGSSLDYRQPTQSPSVFNLVGAAAWKIADRWRLKLGGSYSSGSDSKGADQMLTSVQALTELEVDSSGTVSFWFRPEMNLSAYHEQLRRIHYVTREIVLQPERVPVNLGSTLLFRRGILTLALKGSYAQYTNKSMPVVDSGIIRVEYGEARIAGIAAEVTIGAMQSSRLEFSGFLTSAHETGSSAQLPMVPVVRVSGKGEIDFHKPLTVWCSAEYQGPRNVDRLGTQSISGFVLLNAGMTTSALPRTVLSGEVRNLLNWNYERWGGYVAPGIELNLTAKISLQ